MAKILAFVVLVPFLALFAFKCILFSEFDNKSRYLKDNIDAVAYKVKLTGVLTADEYSEFVQKINKISKFEDTASQKAIVMQRGVYDGNNNLTVASDYTVGDVLSKGDAFIIYVKSSEVCNYSRVQNGGISPDDTKNLYYVTKAAVRIEKVN